MLLTRSAPATTVHLALPFIHMYVCTSVCLLSHFVCALPLCSMSFLGIALISLLLSLSAGADDWRCQVHIHIPIYSHSCSCSCLRSLSYTQILIQYLLLLALALVLVLLVLCVRLAFVSRRLFQYFSFLLLFSYCFVLFSYRNAVRRALQL